MTLAVNPLLGQELERSPEPIPALAAIAEAIAEDVRRIAREELQSDDDYSAQIEVVVGFDDDGKVVARVNANDEASGFLEFGTRSMAPRALLRRGAEAAGAHVEEATR